ncbi:hypothetical protein OIU74_021679 [Salix koriyanagi]|uniref:Uncharacterized protein n=1 Tax=Salix koriyanagi TaxID=2511006 RepID=A0A9Q0WJ61_9ROSI|nr:hypothetical protein OIU74_021679 [Salix koriyanagi]
MLPALSSLHRPFTSPYVDSKRMAAANTLMSCGIATAFPSLLSSSKSKLASSIPLPAPLVSPCQQTRCLQVIFNMPGLGTVLRVSENLECRKIHSAMLASFFVALLENDSGRLHR